MTALETFITDVINDNLWKLVPFLLVAAGLYFSARTFIVQITRFPDMLRAVAESPKGSDKNDRVDSYEGISAFKAFTISAASRVGTGNVAGVALAISLGGPGAVFWMWVIALLGGATSFIESTLAQLYKTREGDAYHGGPAYYMTRGLGWKPLAVVFAVFLAFTYGFVYNAIQTNSIAEAVGVSLGRDDMTFRVVIGAVLAVVTAAIVFGGLKRIANVTQVVVPFMAGAYIIVGVIVVVINIGEVPGMISDIVTHALGLQEITGAAVGAAFMHGMRRGLFSNEAGMGSAPNAAATATVSHPVKQGLVQTLGVYFDTLIVCTITAFIVLLGPQPNYGEEIQGASFTQTALADSVGTWGIHFVTFILFFLAFSSIIGNYYLAQANIQYLTQSQGWLNVFRTVVVAFVFFGSIGSIGLVWNLGDTFAASLVIINLLAIVPLGGIAVKLLRNYLAQQSRGWDPVFHRGMLPELKNVEAWDGTDPATRHAVRRMEDMRDSAR